ncbi:hypothetical protein FACS189427_09940 [Planctomycetales bacterium]|nr:hypothetical protein FACS189427_09940 [Planctomycetales bacterium]
MVALLPFFEQSALYDRFLSTRMTTGSVNWDLPHTISAADGGANNPLASNVGTLYCPTNGVASTKPRDYTAGSNYRFCLGDNPGGYSGSANPNDYFLKGWRGCFGTYRFLNMATITDGTSNTVMFSERAIVTALAASKNVKTVFPTVPNGSIWNAANAGSSIPSTLASRAAVYNLAVNGEYTATPGADRGAVTGWNYAGSNLYNSSFTTTMPPNAPGCYMQDSTWNVLLPPTSFHSGGVQAALLDASVRFVSDTVDSGTADCFPASQMMDGAVTGRSPFGVWGAMGSRDGGEATSL